MARACVLLLQPLIRLAQRNICNIKDCGKPTQGKQYCVKHLSLSARRQLPKEISALIRSDCCDAKCTVGDAHEYGEQYCSKCKAACCWKAVV